MQLTGADGGAILIKLDQWTRELAFSDLWDFLPQAMAGDGGSRIRTSTPCLVAPRAGKSYWLRWYLIRFCCAVQRGVAGRAGHAGV